MDYREDRTQSMLNLVYARCESRGVDVWTNISPPSLFTETTKKKKNGSTDYF